jgi:hypothetical protein
MTGKQPCRQCGTTNWSTLTGDICSDCQDKNDYEEALARGLVIVQESPNRFAVVRLHKRATIARSDSGADLAGTYLTGEQVFRGTLYECRMVVRRVTNAPKV